MLNFKKNLRLSLFLIVMLAATGLMCGSILQQPSTGMTAAIETVVERSVYELPTIFQGDEDNEVTPEVEVAKIVINAPSTGDVGELIRFDLSDSVAESFKWLRVPESVDFEVYANGRRAVFSARKPGEYMVIVACAYQGTVDVTTHTVIIIGPDPAPLPPGPNNNYPVVPKPADGASLVVWMPYWCSSIQCPKDETMRLAASFESIVATIAAGINTTPQEIIVATSTANRQALGESITAWMPVLQNLQSALKTRSEAGIIVTAEQHAEAWREIAEGLRAYAALFNVLED